MQRDTTWEDLVTPPPSFITYRVDIREKLHGNRSVYMGKYHNLKRYISIANNIAERGKFARNIKQERGNNEEYEKLKLL